jgi:hypothetical protein
MARHFVIMESSGSANSVGCLADPHARERTW